MNKLIVSILFSIISVSAYSQNKIDSLTNFILGNPVSIYEYGAPLTSCETNFHNLFKNWTAAIITNVREYKLLDFTFVETLTDTMRYNYYRNYFSSGEPVYNSKTCFENTNIKFKYKKGKRFEEKTNIYECYVRPGFIHNELYDQRGLTAESKKILSEEFTKQAKELLMREINIDTMKLIHTTGEIYKTSNVKIQSDLTVRNMHVVYDLASTDSISPQLFNVLVKQKRDYGDLSIEERRSLSLQELLVMRVSAQFEFNKTVHFGDKVYVVRFSYNGVMYTVYVICNPDSKKVVMDSFFKNITIKTI